MIYKQGRTSANFMLGRPDHTKMAEDKCPECGEVFSKREGYQRKKHLSQRHGLTLFWRCTLCEYKTHSRRYHDHQKHWQVRHFEEPIPPVAQLEREEPEPDEPSRASR